jgi:serine/threonine protein kinase
MTSTDDQFTPQERTQYTGGSPASAAEFRPGQIIGDNYQVLAWIGAGGMGNVYRVRHNIMQTEYALKTLSADKITDVAWRRFQTEAQAIGRMSHPNVVGIYNLGLHDGRLPYYVMDLLKGQSLLDILKTNGPLDVDAALSIFIEVCAGIGYAHKKGIVHRDIKPGNLLLVDQPGQGGGKVKIVDFGIAKLTGITDATIQKLTNAGEVCGSPYYMSPEQCEAGKIDARSDIYSLGCTLFEALTGSPPFKGRNAMETMLLHQSAKVPSLTAITGGKTFPPMLERAIATMLAKAPMDRYQNMERVSEDLDSVLKGDNQAVQPYVRTGATKNAGTRRPAVSRSQLQEPAHDQEQKIKIKPLLLSALALGLMVIACVVWQIDIKYKQESGGIDTTPFASEVKDASGKKQIVFNFPQDIDLGEILLDSPVKSEDTKSIVCQGKQTIEAGHQLYFFPSMACIYHPQYFYNFRPDTLHSITLPPVPAKLRASIKLVLPEISRLKGLHRLDCLNCNGIVDAVVPLLDQCPALDDLVLNANNVSIKALIQTETIKRIKFLTYTYKGIDFEEEIELHAGEHHGGHRGGHHQDRDGEEHHRGRGHDDMEARETIKQEVTPLLQCLTNSPNLVSLEIPNVPLSAQDLQIIGQLKNLRTVDLSNSNIVGTAVDALSDLTNLQSFHVDNCIIGESAIPAFKKLAKHSLKYIFMTSLAMTPETIELYRKELPGVMVNP